MVERVPVTPAGHASLQEELRKLKYTERPAIVPLMQRVATTVAQSGDDALAASVQKDVQAVASVLAKHGVPGELLEVEPDEFQERTPGELMDEIVSHIKRRDVFVADMMAAMQAAADEVASEGRKAYVIPGGGSNPVGATGYVACAEEILAQTFELGISIDRVICASGSTGTHAGLITGFHGNNSNIPVIGINVSRPRDEQEQLVYDLVQQTAVHVGVHSDISAEAVRCYDEYVGPGYSLPSPQMAEAVRMLAGLEGILMDPVYTGKAMAGLIDLVRKGIFDKNENILFIHTGGSPALYVYMEEILDAGNKD